jgi:uncharacterized membrane protein
MNAVLLNSQIERIKQKPDKLVLLESFCMKNKIIIYTLGAFFVFAGINHFVNPHFYYPLIPDYLPFPIFINLASGLLEIALGLALFTKSYRRISALGIFILLLLFIPSHVYFVQIGSCIPDGLCVPAYVGWIRLLVIHPILLLWAFWVYRKG